MKKITGVIALAVLSSAAFANTIVPETSRDGKTKNSSAIATTQQMRTFVAGEYNSANLEFDTTTPAEEDTTNLNFYGGWANKMITVEADINMGDSEETGDPSEDNSEYSLLAGYRINKQIAVGLGYTMGSEDSISGGVNTEIDTSRIEIAASYNMADLTLGLSFGINSKEQGNKDDSWNTLTVGVGSNANNMSWEAGLNYHMESGDAATEFNMGSKWELFAGMTKVINNIEIDADLTYASGDAYATPAAGANNDYSNLDFNVDAEFLVGKMFYITPGLYYSNKEESYETVSRLGLSADFGYRANRVDATFGIDYDLSSNYESTDPTDLADVDFDRLAWKVNVAYNF